MSRTSSAGNNGPGEIIASVCKIRLAIFLITTSLIGTCAVFNVIDFSQSMDEPLVIELPHDNITGANFTTNSSTLTSLTFAPTTKTEYQDIPPIYLFLCGLSLSAVSAFLRASFIIKLFMMMLTVILQTLVLYSSRLFEQYDLHSDSM